METVTDFILRGSKISGDGDYSHEIKRRLLLGRKAKTNLISSAQSLSHVQLFETPWTAACQVSLSISNSQSLLKLMSIESVMPSNHLILCHPLLFPPSIFPSIRVFSSESVFRIRWPKYWSFSFSISTSNEYSGLISFMIDWLDLCSPREPQESSPTPQFKSINSSVLSLCYTPTLHPYMLLLLLSRFSCVRLCANP